MGNQAFRTAYTLDPEQDQDRVKLNRTFVTAITDQTALLAAGTLHLEELQSVYNTIIIILGKIIAFLKDNCYHDSGNSTKEQASLYCGKKDRAALEGWDLSFSLVSPSSIEYLSSILMRH